MKLKAVVPMVVERSKKRQPLNVVPVEVRNEDMSGNRLAVELAAEGLSQNAETGAAVEDVDLVSQAYFDAGGIPSIAHVFRLRRRGGPAYAPELDPHTSSRD